jgi:CHAT domain-containing protein/tetratricopeptide (TPR) repeat protein
MSPVTAGVPRPGRPITVVVVLVCFGLAPAPGAAGPEPTLAAPLTEGQCERLRERERLRKKALDLRQADRLAEAVTALEQALAAQRQALGPDYDEVGGLPEQLADVHDAREDFAAARAIRQGLLALRVRRHGEKDWRAAAARLGLANGDRLARSAPEARRLLRRAGQQLARAAWLRQRGAFRDSQAAAEKALATRRELLGEGHFDTATAHNELGVSLQARGDYAAAQKAFDRALATYRAAVGDRHPSTAIALANLASALQHQGRYADARRHHERALAAIRAARGEDHPDTATLHNNFGALLRGRGEFAAARREYEQALAVRRRHFGDDAPETALVLNNLGNLLQGQGDRAAARPYLERALAIYEREPGPGRYRAAAVRINLGVLLNHLGDHAAARTHLEEALAVNRKALGKDHPLTLAAVYNLAHVLRAQKQLGPARRCLEEVLAARRRTVGDNHPETANALFALAVCFLGQGEPGTALRHCQEGLAIRRAVLGDGHPDTAQGLLCVGFLYEFLGRDEEARSCLRESFARKLQLAEDAVAGLSEAEALAYVRATDSGRDALLTLMRHLPGDHAEEAYAAVWARRALVTRAVLARRDLAGRVPAAGPLWQELADTRARLARLTVAPPRPDQATQRRRRVAELTAGKERLERELAAASAAFRRRRQVERAGIADLGRRLPPGTAVLDLVRTRPFDLRLPGVGELRAKGLAGALQLLQDADRASDAHYEAFVLRGADRPGGYAVARVALGPAGPIDRAARRWREAFGTGEADRPGAPARRGQEGPDRALRRLVWEKVEPHLSGCRAVVVVPDADLTRVPWAALPGKKPGTYLLEEYALATALHGQQLYELLTREPPSGDRLLVVGGVDYDADAAPPPRKAPNGAPRVPPPAGPRPLRWPYLPGTLREARKLSALWDGPEAVLLSGAQANRAAVLRELPRARFAHLATHGYFADRQFRSAFGWDAAGGPVPAEGAPAAGWGAGATERNPLVLSGLVLAGANRAPAGDGGILTGEEVAGLDLSRAELVVLSACETGRGEGAGGEGVFSLQRAFHLAGARNVVASLWQVDDEATAALMALFYHNLWRAKLPPLEALRQAQLTVYRHPERIPALARARGPDFDRVARRPAEAPAGARAPARLWAGFVLSGFGR